jgi:hypothetical protein
MQVFVGTKLFRCEFQRLPYQKWNTNCIPYTKKKPDIGTQKTPEIYFVSTNHTTKRNRTSVMDKYIKQVKGF